jgi:hypothetical protein
MGSKSKFQIGDRVIIQFKSKNRVSPVWNGVIKYVRLDGSYIVTLDEKQVDGQDHTIDEKDLKLNKQWYREQRLKGLLDE